MSPNDDVIKATDLWESWETKGRLNVTSVSHKPGGDPESTANVTNHWTHQLCVCAGLCSWSIHGWGESQLLKNLFYIISILRYTNNSLKPETYPQCKAWIILPNTYTDICGHVVVLFNYSLESAWRMSSACEILVHNAQLRWGFNTTVFWHHSNSFGKIFRHTVYFDCVCIFAYLKRPWQRSALRVFKASWTMTEKHVAGIKIESGNSKVKLFAVWKTHSPDSMIPWQCTVLPSLPPRGESLVSSQAWLYALHCMKVAAITEGAAAPSCCGVYFLSWTLLFHQSLSLKTKEHVLLSTFTRITLVSVFTLRTFIFIEGILGWIYVLLFTEMDYGFYFLFLFF